MKIYTLILQKPLKIKTYSSKEALIKDNDMEALDTSRSTLEKYDFKRFYFVNSKAIITLTEVQSSGDIDRKNKSVNINDERNKL